MRPWTALLVVATVLGLAACAKLAGTTRTVPTVHVTTTVQPAGKRVPGWLSSRAKEFAGALAVPPNVTVTYILGPFPIVALEGRLSCDTGLGKWQCPAAAGSPAHSSTYAAARYTARAQRRINWSFGGETLTEALGDLCDEAPPSCVSGGKD